MNRNVVSVTFHNPRLMASTSHDSNLSNPTFPSTSNSSQSLALIASAFDQSGHSIFVSNPQRLSILSIQFDSSVNLDQITSISSNDTQHSLPFPSSGPSTSNPINHPNNSSTQSSHLIAAINPDLSSHPPLSLSASSSSTTTTSTGIAARLRGGSRPKSADIGARAREALYEIGRAARGVAAANSNSSQSTDLNSSALDSNSRSAGNVRSTMGGLGVGGGAHKGDHSNSYQQHANLKSSSNQAFINSNLSSTSSLSITSEIIVKPHSFTFGRDSRLTTCSIPLDISSNFKVHGRGGLESSTYLSSIDRDSDDDDDENSETESGSASSNTPPIEFVGDPNPISSANFKSNTHSTTTTNSNANGRAGVFVPFPDGATTSSSRSSEESERDLKQQHKRENSHRRKNQNQRNRAPFDPNRLLLKVSPPSDSTCRKIWSRSRSNPNSPVRVEKEVKLSFRLRLTSSAPFSDDGNNNSSSNNSNRRGFTSVQNEKGLGEVIFLTSESPEQIINAIAGGLTSDSVLSSEQVARLEGITRIVVNPRTEAGVSPRGARETEFEWKWSSLKRKRGKASSSGKCCCAFVELDQATGKASILSAFTFWVEMPSPSETEWNSSASPSNNFNVISSNSNQFSETDRRRAGSRPETPALIAALSLSNNRSDLFLNSTSSYPNSSQARTSWRKTTFSSPTEPPGYIFKRRSASDGRHQSHLQQMNGNLNRESSFSSSNYVEKALNELQLNLNHTELSLAESYSDSPILRAAITNLERRTASIKKSCKTSLKAFNELRTQITSLEASQNSIDDALNDLGTSNFNSSVDFLNRHFLLDVRAKNSKFRIQELDEMEKHFERPLQILLEKCRNVQEQLKTFESESKTYYSQTQKWLANKDASAESSQGKNEGDEKSAKLERSDEKQRLRQLKFDHARVELYKSLLDLHGGESELKLLDSLLMLSEFYSNQSKEVWGTCKGLSIQETRSILEGIKAQGQLEGKRIDFDLNETLHVLRELSDKIAISENCLNEVKDGIKDSNVNSTSTWDLLGMHPSDSTDQGLQNTAPTRQPGHRIKHLLTSLGMVGGGSSSSASANQPTSSSPPPAQAEMTSSVSSSTVASPTKPTSHGLRKKVSLKLKSSQGGVVDKAAGITSPVFGAFNRLRSGDGPLSPTKSNLSTPNPTTGSSTTFDPPSEVINIPPPVTRSPRLGGGGTALMDYAPESPIGDRTMMAGIGLGNPTLTASHSPKNRRSNSHGAYGSASPQARMLELAAVAASSQGSPRMRRGLQGRSPSLSRSSSDGHATMETLRSTLSSDSKRASQGLGLGGMSTPISEHESNQTSAAAAAAPRFGNTTSLSPTSNASRGRKKEGILWVMSKAIAGGPGGADAPRAANRTNAWKESWVVLSGSGHLGEYADWKDAKILSPSSPLIDLRFATVREARGVDRRFCFEIVTRENRRLFQASDESSMKDWVNSISKAIESLINGTSSVRQIDKVARSSEKGGLGLGLGGISPRLDGSDWGTGGGLRAFGDSTSSSANQAFGNNQRSSSGWQISQSKAFSQSLTDLSSVASGAGRFFGRNTDSGNDAFVSNAPGAKSGKRDSKNSSMLNSKSAHLSTLSESQARGDITISTPDSEGFPTTPIKGDSSPSASDLSRPVRHERGISNKTPVSGYVDQSPRMANINLPGNVTSPQRPTDVQIHIKDESTSTDISDWEFDRRIEELVHSNYGSTMNASHSELALPLSMSPSTSSEGFLRRQRKDSSNNSRQKHGRNHSVSSVSNLDFGAATSSSSSSQQSNSAGQRWDRTSSQDSNIRSKAARAAEIQEVASRRGNDRCADCGEPDPRWASWSLSSSPCCIFICISCSGVHRGLGVQISKVKSVDLDDWTEEQLKAARLWGNVKANSYWEHSRGNDFPRGPRNGINGNGKEAGGKEFYLMKYVQGRWKAEGTLDEWLNEYQNGNQEGQFNNVRIGEAFNSTPTLADRAGQVQLQVPNRSSLDCSGDTAPASRDLSRSSSKGSERIGG